MPIFFQENVSLLASRDRETLTLINDFPPPPTFLSLLYYGRRGQLNAIRQRSQVKICYLQLCRCIQAYTN